MSENQLPRQNMPRTKPCPKIINGLQKNVWQLSVNWYKNITSEEYNILLNKYNSLQEEHNIKQDKYKTTTNKLKHNSRRTK